LKDLEKKPEVRCGIAQQALKALELLDPAVRKRILDRFPEATLQAIYLSKEDDWLPLEYDIQLSDNMIAELSEEKYIKLYIASNKVSIDSSFLGPLVRSSFNLFRVSPKTLFKFAPKIWSFCYRNCGTISVAEKGPFSVQVILEDLPFEFASNKGYLLGVVGFIQAIENFTKAKNTKVVIEQQSPMNRRVVFSVSWTLG
jgi:hypothetical protein